MRRSLALHAILAALPAVLPGCARPRAEPAELSVTIERVEDRSGTDIPDAYMRALVERELEASPMFTIGGANAVPVEVWYGEVRVGADNPVLVLHLKMEAPPGLLIDPRDGLAATVELEQGGEPLDVARVLPLASRRAVTVLEANLMLARGDAVAIDRLLRSADRELVLLALEWIRDHRLAHLADAVAERLGDRDDEVVRLAIEALGEVGGPQHVPSLVGAARLADQGHAHRLYEALASLGGEHARGFLEFAVRNEEDPAMAAMAQHALERIDWGERAQRHRRDDPGDSARRIRRGHRR